MILSIRVDERLLHGQILTKWVGYHQCQRVVVADESANADPFLKSLMRASLPQRVLLEVCGLERSLEFFSEERPVRTLLLVRNAEALCRLVRMGAHVTQANFALPPKEQELPFVRELAARGVQMTIQMVPDSPPTLWHDIIDER